MLSKSRTLGFFGLGLITLATVVMTSTTALTQGLKTTVRDPAARRALPLQTRTTIDGAQMICTLSLFFSFDGTDKVGPQLAAEGRGLATCENDQGFTTELPVHAALKAEPLGEFVNTGELSFSANSSAFVVPRELNQIQDFYKIRTYASNYGPTNTVVFRGGSHDLVIEMKLSTATQAFQKVKLNSLSLSFDENAPSFQ